MPVVTHRDDARRLLTVKVSDPWSVEELAVSIDRQLAENTWKYDTIYDLRGSTHLPTEPDILWLVKQGDQFLALRGQRGLVAVLIDQTVRGRQHQQYAEYARTQNKVALRVFDDEAAAHEWLSSDRQ